MNTASIKSKLESIEQELTFIKKLIKEGESKASGSKLIADLCGIWNTKTSLEELGSIKIQPKFQSSE